MPPAPAPAPRRTWLYLSLFVNIVLLAVIGFAAAHFLTRGPRDGWGRGPDGLKPFMPQQIERLVPDSAKDKIAKIRDAHAATFKSLFDAHKSARDGLRTVFESDTFDAGALKAALTQLRQTEEAIRSESADAVVEELTAMTPDERKATRDNLKQMHDRGPPPDGPPPPPRDN